MRIDTARYGIILNTEHYDQCVAFYRDLFGLPVLFEKENDGFQFTCFAYGAAYLMVEEGGTASEGVKSIAEGSYKLRFNVNDLAQALLATRSWGIEATIAEHV